ncbi:hypothetical protein CEXT_592751 [Caerostris extrusa]|uniref:Uncharacterized protein n=1 Tax=Caerostris extrusa TaxID=172846 RepID=A0AAV4WPU6_CAEEX|nr:hypothetical protein CEXT_592751 [Caerostris extrusa]
MVENYKNTYAGCADHNAVEFVAHAGWCSSIFFLHDEEPPPQPTYPGSISDVSIGLNTHTLLDTLDHILWIYFGDALNHSFIRRLWNKNIGESYDTDLLKHWLRLLQISLSLLLSSKAFDNHLSVTIACVITFAVSSSNEIIPVIILPSGTELCYTGCVAIIL